MCRQGTRGRPDNRALLQYMSFKCELNEFEGQTKTIMSSQTSKIRGSSW